MTPHFHITILTIFPEMFPGCLGHSLAGQALKKGIWQYDVINIRDSGVTKHHNVDSKPYGGGEGLVMRADVLGRALDKAIEQRPNAEIYYFSPRGRVLNQRLVEEVVSKKDIIILCGRFEGIDERIIDEYNIREISIGDFVLSGGEVAAQVLLDTCIRLLSGVLSNDATLLEESFSSKYGDGKLLEYPLYTRPEEWRGRKVPDILLSGDHAKIEKWKKSTAEEITKKRRPDLIKK